MHIQKMAFVYLPVRDAERARHFYESVLGLSRGMSAPNGVWTEYDLPQGGCLALFCHESQPPGGGATGGTVALEVDDLDAWQQRLQAEGITLAPEVQGPACRMLNFKDPDGNPLMLHQRQPAATDTEAIAAVLQAWTEATRLNQRDKILQHHAPEAVIFDVLPPLQYQCTAAYQASWDDWQPQTSGEFGFSLHELQITVNSRQAFAHGLLHCQGTLSKGTAFEDWCRATFCLTKSGSDWQIVHQHISRPAGG